MKLAIFSSFPIHHQVPLFRAIKNNSQIDLTVYFQELKDNKELFFDEQFNRKINLGVSLQEGYKYKEVNNLFKFIFLLKKYKPDALIFYGWGSLFNLLSIFISSLFKAHIMIRGESPLNQENKKTGVRQYIKKFLLKILFKKVSAFLYIGEQNKKFYKSYGVPEKKLFFTPYSVDNERFQKSYKELKPNKQKLRNELGIKKDDVVILFVGKFIYKKRPLHLLKAYKKVLDKYSKENNIHLIFVGEGKLRKEMEDYIDKNNLSNVHLVGFKNQTELPEYYTMADIFVLPSGIGETWGLVTNEAMNFRLPIIISGMPGSGYDLVKEGENGYKFPVGDIDTLSKKIFKLVDNKEKREKFGEKSFEIIQGHNYRKDVKGIIKAFNSIKK